MQIHCRPTVWDQPLAGLPATFLMILIKKPEKDGEQRMEGRKVFTSHSALAALASKRIVEGRVVNLAAAIRDHEGRVGTGLSRRAHDDALYRRLRQLGGNASSGGAA
jgi:hypothetical protein